MKKLLMLALVLGMVSAFALPAVAVKPPATATLTVPGQADVTFDHAAHVALSSNCKQCHHYGVGNGQCDECHGNSALPQAPSIAAVYTACKTCHTSTPAPAQPASCSDYGDDKAGCVDDSNCRWARKKGVCKDRR